MPPMNRAVAVAIGLFAVIIVAVVVVVASGGGDDGNDGTSTTLATGPTDETGAPGTDPATASGGPATTPTSVPATTAPPASPPTTSAPRTTATAPPPTTTPGVEPNNPPVVTVGPPNPLERFEAFFDAASGRFIASVPLTANVTDPEGDPYTVDWFSSLDGYLGTGQTITAAMSPDLDTSQPVVTARATDATGAVGEGSIQIIVWIRSDE